MSNKEDRLEKLNRLNDKMGQTKEIINSENPRLKKLNRKLDELKICWKDYEDVHMKYITREQNEEDKNAVVAEHKEIVEDYDNILDPAEDLADTLIAAAATPNHQVNDAHQKAVAITQSQDKGKVTILCGDDDPVQINISEVMDPQNLKDIFNLKEPPTSLNRVVDKNKTEFTRLDSIQKGETYKIPFKYLSMANYTNSTLTENTSIKEVFKEEIKKSWVTNHKEEIQHALVLSLAAYDNNSERYLKDEMTNHNFDSITESKHGECKFLMAEKYEENHLYVSFRGTENMDDVNSDLQIFLKESGSKFSRGKFHSGFFNRAELFPLKKILAAKQFYGKKLILCGHSLEGAVSSIVTAQALLEKETLQANECIGDIINITFGAPLFGEENAKRVLNEKNISSKLFHFVAEKDPIPCLLSMTQNISAMSHTIDNQIRNIFGAVSEDYMNLLLETKKKYQETLANILPAVGPILKLATMISPASNVVKTAKNIHDVVQMVSILNDGTDKAKNAYTPIGNYFFLEQDAEIKFLSTGMTKFVTSALNQKLEEAKSEDHKLMNYRDLCQTNKIFIEDVYPDTREKHINDAVVLIPRKILCDRSFSPWMKSAELRMMKISSDEVMIRLVLHGMNLFEISLPDCSFNLGFPFGNSLDNTKVKKIKQVDLDTRDHKELQKNGISVTGNMEEIVIEQTLKMSAKDISEKLSASDHGTKITIATQFGQTDYIIPRNKFGNEIKPPSLAQLARHESIALVLRKALQRVMATGNVMGCNIEEQKLLKEIITLAKLTLPPERCDELKKTLLNKDIQRILSDENEYRKVDNLCTEIGNAIKIEIAIKMEKIVSQQILIAALSIGASIAIGYIAGPGMLVVGAADVLSKTAIAGATAAAATGGVTTGYMANRYFTEELPEKSYKVVLKFITEQLFKVVKERNDKDDCTDISDLLHDDNVYSTEKALLEMFNKEKSITDNFEGSIIEKTTESTKQALLKKIDCIRCVHEIRNLLATQCFIGLVGLQDAGKTTLLNKIWGLDSKTGLFDHTDIPELHEITKKVSIIDFPGSNGLEYHRNTFSNCGAMNNVIILVVPFAGDIHTHICEEIAKVYEVMTGSESCKVLICINKCGEKLESLKRELVEQKDPMNFIRNRYVQKLNEQFINKPGVRVREEHIIFTDWKADKEALNFGIKGVDYVKKMIKTFLIELNVIASDDSIELEAAVSPRADNVEELEESFGKLKI